MEEEIKKTCGNNIIRLERRWENVFFEYSTNNILIKMYRVSYK